MERRITQLYTLAQISIVPLNDILLLADLYRSHRVAALQIRRER